MHAIGQAGARRAFSGVAQAANRPALGEMPGRAHGAMVQQHQPGPAINGQDRFHDSARQRGNIVFGQLPGQYRAFAAQGGRHTQAFAIHHRHAFGGDHTAGKQAELPRTAQGHGHLMLFRLCPQPGKQFIGALGGQYQPGLCREMGQQGR